MTEKTQQDAQSEHQQTEWMKSPAGFLKFMSMFTESASSGTHRTSRSRSIESWESMLKMWRLIMPPLDDKESMDIYMKGFNALPEILVKVAQAGWDASTEMQRKAIEKAGKIGQKTEAFNFDQLDEGLFKAWRDIYEQELSQFLKIPSVGLARYYQERFNILLDRYNIFEAAFSEFLYIVYQPFEKTKMVLQDKLEELAVEGKIPEKSKEIYNMYIKTLEGHYMTLFKTSEYEEALREMLSQLNAFWMAKDEVARDILQILPLPTHKDMDELYKDLYVLKKRVRALEDKLKSKTE